MPGYVLKKVERCTDRYLCDRCDEEIKRGTPCLSCASCDYDVCSGCRHKDSKLIKSSHDEWEGAVKHAEHISAVGEFLGLAYAVIAGLSVLLFVGTLNPVGGGTEITDYYFACPKCQLQLVQRKW